MNRLAKMALAGGSVLVMLTAVWCEGRRALSGAAADNGEIEIHRAPGAQRAGSPAKVGSDNSGRIRLTVTEAGRPTFCRVNVVGSDGNYYEPEENPLAPWSLARLGNREGKGPFRYYGWFFYCDGDCEIRVPPGETRVEVWKGFEYRPVTVTKNVPAGRSVQIAVPLQRGVDMTANGWYSGDTHIHLERRSDEEDQRALDLIAAEDIRFGHILCMNDPRSYRPVMDQQIWHQLQGLGPESVRQRGAYQISSGQEYRCGTFGHICLIGGNRLVDADGLKTDPNNWPPFGMVADELHGIGGFAFHAHGGYSKEIYVDFAHEATDGVELLQFAEYRGISLQGWYHILNAGYRFPAVGASDYPYCRALGDCRTYVQLSERPSFENWNQAAAEGRSFFTTGPLLQVTVDGHSPGATLHLPEGKHVLTLSTRIESLVSPVDEVQIIVGGHVAFRQRLSGDARTKPIDWSKEIEIDDSTWIALRAFSKSGAGRDDSEAHTNPIYVNVGDRPIRQRESILWLLDKIDERIAYQRNRDFPERARVLAYYLAGRKALAERLPPGDE